MNSPVILLRTAALATASTIAFAASSCTQYQAQGAGLGALGGAAVGAIVGDDSSDVITGAVIGAAAGAGAAALAENQHQTGSGHPTAPPPAKPRKTSNYPLATPHPTNPDLVISPYRPHNVIDVKGFRTGQLARDPSTAPIDPATGKSDLAQAKIFELP